jgi:hypothetical protein
MSGQTRATKIERAESLLGKRQRHYFCVGGGTVVGHDAINANHDESACVALKHTGGKWPTRVVFDVESCKSNHSRHSCFERW